MFQIELGELLNYSNPHTKRYQKIIEEENANERAQTQGAFGQIWQDLPPSIKNNEGFFSTKATRNFLKSKLKGEILIDLGSGLNPTLLELALELECCYIHIDKFRLQSNRNLNPKKAIYQYKEGWTEILDVQADMLDFLSRMKSNSANITINGIDSYIIPNKNYHEALAREILRVIKPEGIVFGNKSTSLQVIRKKRLLSRIATETLRARSLRQKLLTHQIDNEILIFEKK